MRSRTIAARVPAAFAAEVEAQPAAAGMTISDYIARALRGRTVENHPALAALAGILQIAATVERAGDCDRAVLDTLREHVATLARTARVEQR